MRRTTCSRRLLVAAAALLGVTACGPMTGPPAESPTPATTITSPPAWEPPDATAAIELRSPGDGGTRTVAVGDRVRLPSTGSPGGLDLRAWKGRLVPYGDRRTFLAVAAGRVQVEESVYDTARPCVPPRPVATFDLVIGEGKASDIPAPQRLPLDESARTVSVVPGQELTAPAGWRLSVSSRRDAPVIDHQGQGTYALRPGTISVSLARHWPQRTGEPTPAPVTVRVIDPSADGSSSALSTAPGEPAAQAFPAGSPGHLAAGAALPACG